METLHGAAEAAGTAYRLAVRTALFQVDPEGAPEFQYGPLHHVEPLPHQRRAGVPELQRRGDPYGGEVMLQAVADAPHVVKRQAGGGGRLRGFVGEVAHPAARGVLLGGEVGDVGEGLGRRDSRAHRDAGLATYDFP